MIGFKLKSLTDYLLTHLSIASEQINSYVEEGQIVPVGKKHKSGFDGDSLIIARFKYTARFEIERLADTPGALLTRLTLWLLEHDAERFDQGLENPILQIDAETEKLADIEFLIRFDEELEIKEDPDGDYLYKGTNYSLQSLPFDEVDEIAVGDNEALNTDLPVTND